jgi:MoxR-like ATPase
LRAAVASIRVSDELKRYIVDLVASTRHTPGVLMGASPRASLTWLHTAQALAVTDALGFVTPDHVQELAQPVLAHRLVLDAEAQFGGLSPARIVEDILAHAPVPR